MTNQFFLSYFLARFSDLPLNNRSVRGGLALMAFLLTLGIWTVLLSFDSSIAGWGALASIAMLFCCFRAVVTHFELREKVVRLQQLSSALLATNTDCLKLLSVDGRILNVSDVGVALMDLTSTTGLVGKDWLSFWGDDTQMAQGAFGRALVGEQTRFEGCCETATGRRKRWDSILLPLKDSRGKVFAVLCPSRDVTAEFEARENAFRAKRLLEDIENHIPVVIWSASPDFRTLHHISAGFERMWQLPIEALKENPRAWQARLPTEDLYSLQSSMRRLVETAKAGQADFRLVLDNGVVRWVRASATPVLDRYGVVERIVSVCVDVTEEKRRLSELDRLAHQDTLTGLANRYTLIQHLKVCCERGTPFSLVLADIDRFKVLNDTAGTVMADELLRTVGEGILESLPSGSFVARPGGDEFAFIVEGSKSVLELAGLYDSVRRRVGVPHLLGRVPTTLTLSAGIARYPEDGTTPEALMSSADVAMYAAKRGGRDGYRLFGAEESAAIGSFQLERELRGALSKGEFVLHFQPQFWTRSGQMAGVEALIRWNRPQYGRVSPDVFIPLLEESGLILDVGHWVFEETLRNLVEWRAASGREVLASVNVSARQLSDANLPVKFADAARRCGIPVSNLTLEVTESALVQQGDSAQGVLREFQRIGFQIALDDFGTGYSSLSYLTRLRPNVLKLDKSLVDEIDTDVAARTVVAGVVALAKALTIRVVAEGVERQTQLAALAALDCELVQGFLLGKPEAHDGFVERYLAGEELVGNR